MTGEPLSGGELRSAQSRVTSPKHEENLKDIPVAVTRRASTCLSHRSGLAGNALPFYFFRDDKLATTDAVVDKP